MDHISFADFQKMDIRVGEIKFAEDIPGADKIYKVIVDIGNEERIMVAGIKQYYSQEELKGKRGVCGSGCDQACAPCGYLAEQIFG